MIQVKEVCKHFDTLSVLQSTTLHVRKGTIYGLVGPNGAGKTTLINHICGVMQPESGTVQLGGEPVFENAAAKQKVFHIADDWFHFSTYTIKQMAAFYRKMYPNFQPARYEALREVFRLDEKRQLRKLSKGQKKQVAFWLALSAMPEVLILDEPLDGLDPVMRKQVLGLVIADVADRALTVLVSSHNLRELEDICDWVGILHEGRLILEKPLDVIKGSVCKYQLAYKTDKTAFLEETEGLLHLSKIGSVYNAIVKGEPAEITARFSGENPILLEQVSLTLEEVFIYELGGLGYDLKNIIF